VLSLNVSLTLAFLLLRLLLPLSTAPLALHCAAETLQSGIENENYNYETMKTLRMAMSQERPSQDPVGVNAPVDLSGRTPLGRQNRSKKVCVCCAHECISVYHAF